MHVYTDWAHMHLHKYQTQRLKALIVTWYKQSVLNKPKNQVISHRGFDSTAQLL